MADTTGEAAVPAAVPPALETSAEPQARGCSGTGIPGVTVLNKNGKPTGKYQTGVASYRGESYHGYLPVIYMVICVDNSHLGALQKTPDPSWLALTVARADWRRGVRGVGSRKSHVLSAISRFRPCLLYTSPSPRD